MTKKRIAKKIGKKIILLTHQSCDVSYQLSLLKVNGKANGEIYERLLKERGRLRTEWNKIPNKAYRAAIRLNLGERQRMQSLDYIVSRKRKQTDMKHETIDVRIERYLITESQFRYDAEHVCDPDYDPDGWIEIYKEKNIQSHG